VKGRPVLPKSTRDLLVRLADRYETAAFLDGDPSWFMHQVSGAANMEATAFVASALSFGSRAQFLPKIGWLLERAGGDMDRWIRSGAFEEDVPPDRSRCFYRFFTCESMNGFFRTYRAIMEGHGTLGGFVRESAGGDALRAVEAICRRFSSGAGPSAVPASAKSACKRVCMFLRWMVRSGSPVDLGLWADALDRATLVVPLDTHVVQESARLGLMKCSSASMCAARRLTAVLAEAFPGDPCRGDYALFGYGVDAGRGEAERGRGEPE